MKVFRVGRRRRQVALVTGVVAAVIMGLALPASAHNTTITAETQCADGAQVITWNIRNSSSGTDLPMSIVSINVGIDGDDTPYTMVGYTSPIAQGASTNGTTTVPGGVTGTISATVHVSWPDGIVDEDYESVELHGDCNSSTTTSSSTSTSTSTSTTTTTVPETTTTTVPETTTTTAPETTTTTVPETTTTTVPEETTTTVPEETTTSSTTVIGSTTLFTTTTTEGSTTTTPITGFGTTTPISGAATTVPGATTLPRTGSGSAYAVFFGLSCLAGGALLLIRRRRNWIR